MVFAPLSESSYLAHIVAALAFIFLGLVLARFISNLLQKMLHELETNRLMKGHTKVNLEQRIPAIVRYLLYAGTAILAIIQLNIGRNVLYVLIGLFVLLGMVFILSGMKGFFSNLFAGILFAVQGKIKKNDILAFDTIQGRVLHRGLTETLLQLKKEQLFVPNAILQKKKLTVIRE